MAFSNQLDFALHIKTNRNLDEWYRYSRFRDLEFDSFWQGNRHRIRHARIEACSEFVNEREMVSFCLTSVWKGQ